MRSAFVERYVGRRQTPQKGKGEKRNAIASRTDFQNKVRSVSAPTNVKTQKGPECMAWPEPLNLN